MIRKFLRTAGFALGFAVLLRSAGAEALEVFACEPEWAALATELGGDKVEVSDGQAGAAPGQDLAQQFRARGDAEGADKPEPEDGPQPADA